MRIAAFLAAACLCAHAAAGSIDIAYDFVDRAQSAEYGNAVAHSASSRETAGRIDLPGIFLHPDGRGDAIARFRDVPVPDSADGARPFLFFHTGIRDGVEWDDPARRPNGVRFSVWIDGVARHEETLAESAWRPRALPLDDLAGRTVDFEFRTNAIDGHTAFDWALFGDPLLVRVGAAAEHPGPGMAVALLHVAADAAGAATLAVGEERHTLALLSGEQWIPLRANAVGDPALVSGDARLRAVHWLRFAPAFAPPALHLKSPVVEADRATEVEAALHNTGRGDYPGGDDAWIECVDAGTGATLARLGAAQALPPLAAGEKRSLRWEDVRIPVPGDYRIVLRGAAFGATLAAEVPVHVFPLLDRPSPDLETTIALERGGYALRVHRDAADAVCLYLEDHRGDAPETLASLYPVARLDFARSGESGARQAGDFKANRIVAAGDTLTMTGTAAGQPVTVLITHGPVAGRFRVEAHLLADRPLGLRHFSGPKVRAGDQGFGKRKDIAIFPGLEYLEGDEHSSSERDLVFPLSWREVPAPHKIAAPIMAVEGRGRLVAVLWDIHQEWAPGQPIPAARFLAPPPASARDYIDLALFAPGVGAFLDENTEIAHTPPRLQPGDTVKLAYWLVADRAADHADSPLFAAGRQGALALRAFQHYFDLFGFPAPSAPPRSWELTKLLSLDAYFDAVWQEDPPGWRHCHEWPAGLFVGHAVPQILIQRDGAAPELQAEIQRRVDLVLDRAVAGQGRASLWSGAGCHILAGELPFLRGGVPEALSAMRDHASCLPDSRENGLWVWRPQGEKYAGLGRAGDHTLGQAAHPSHIMLRAARLTGDPDLARRALDAMRQMDQYAVPRGAQMWECPLYQPDILAAAHAIRAYCEAYRLTGDPAHLDQARHWAWTGLPFLYLWSLDTHPTQLYNVIAVIGSTFHTHSWIGLPVVWCGLVYAYALQDFAQYDDTLDWRAIAEGVTNSAIHQQYTDGPNRGTYPDSWNMVENAPKPADINPENILVNGFRLHGPSPHIRHQWIQPRVGARAAINSAADIVEAEVRDDGGARLRLAAPAGFPVHTLIAPVAPPEDVAGAGGPQPDSAALDAAPEGWLYSEALNGLVIKTAMPDGAAEVTITGLSGR